MRAIKYTIGKIKLFLKAAKNVLVKIDRCKPYMRQCTKRDRGFTKRICVLANRAAELRSSKQRRGRRRGVKNDPDWGGQEVTTWTRTFGRLVERVRDKNSPEKLQPYARIRKTGSHNAETGVR